MVARAGVTIAALLLALIAFLGGGPVEPGPLNPFGLLFVFLAVLAWFAWDAVIGGYTSAGNGPDGAELPLLARFAPIFIKGVTKGMADFGRRARGADDPAAGGCGLLDTVRGGEIRCRVNIIRPSVEGDREQPAAAKEIVTWRPTS
jgi:hypothetical protein